MCIGGNEEEILQLSTVKLGVQERSKRKDRNKGKASANVGRRRKKMHRCALVSKQ